MYLTYSFKIVCPLFLLLMILFHSSWLMDNLLLKKAINIIELAYFMRKLKH